MPREFIDIRLNIKKTTSMPLQVVKVLIEAIHKCFLSERRPYVGRYFKRLALRLMRKC